jgi:hypothetical protein
LGYRKEVIRQAEELEEKQKNQKPCPEPNPWDDLLLRALKGDAEISGILSIMNRKLNLW